MSLYLPLARHVSCISDHGLVMSSTGPITLFYQAIRSRTFVNQPLCSICCSDPVTIIIIWYVVVIPVNLTFNSPHTSMVR